MRSDGRPRGGAFTLGLGLIGQLAVVPHHDQWTHDRSRRTFELAGSQFPVVVVDKQTAIIRSPDGGWRTAGAGKVQIMLDGVEVGLDALPEVQALTSGPDDHVSVIVTLWICTGWDGVSSA